MLESWHISFSYCLLSTIRLTYHCVGIYFNRCSIFTKANKIMLAENIKEIKPFMVDSCLVSQLLKLVRNLHGGILSDFYVDLSDLYHVLSNLFIIPLLNFHYLRVNQYIFCWFSKTHRKTVNQIPCKFMNWDTHLFWSYCNFFKSKEIFPK